MQVENDYRIHSRLCRRPAFKSNGKTCSKNCPKLKNINCPKNNILRHNWKKNMKKVNCVTIIKDPRLSQNEKKNLSKTVQNFSTYIQVYLDLRTTVCRLSWVIELVFQKQHYPHLSIFHMKTHHDIIVEPCEKVKENWFKKHWKRITKQTLKGLIKACSLNETIGKNAFFIFYLKVGIW